MGRPSDYTVEIATQICERIADGESLRKICRDESMPSKGTIMRWLEASGAFQDQYARAREMQADTLADEIIEIADTIEIGVTTETTENGVKTVRGDMVQHRRLRVESRKWYAGKVAAKKYGERLALSNPEGGPVQIEKVLGADEAATKYRELLRAPAL